jgi:ADP-ribosylglycohydrolase
LPTLAARGDYNRFVDHAAHEPARVRRMLLALDGLSVGDAFGQCFFAASSHLPLPGRPRVVPPPPWVYTDDTAMACGIVEVLLRLGVIDQDELAATFARRFMADPDRGYGGMAKSILTEIHDGRAWHRVAPLAFAGRGSMGNGSAMRVAPLGAWFADDIGALVEQAARSAAVTHAHVEGIAGATAVALAAAFAWNHHQLDAQRAGAKLLEFVHGLTPPGQTRDGIARARDLSRDASIAHAADVLGNGERITCPDTVPLCMWIAARHVDNYVDALWTTVSAMGDIDTNCAIVGGIVALSDYVLGVPDAWLAARGPIPLG